MTTNGPQILPPPDFSNYTSLQIMKFKAIMVALNTDEEKALKLSDELSPEDKVKLDEYMEDLDKCEVWKKNTQEQVAYHQREIDSASQRIADNQEKRVVIVHQYAKGLTDIIRNGEPFTSSSPTEAASATDGHTSTNGKHKKKKPGNCNLM